MRKHILPVLLVIAVLLVAVISCKNNPSPTPTPTPTPTRTATLEVYSFKSNYAVGAAEADLVGSLVYTDTTGKVTSVEIKDSSVTKNFDSSAAAQGKILKMTYQGIDTTAVYNIIQPDDFDIAGTIILGKNTTYTFSSGSKTVTKENWKDWKQFYNFTADPESTEPLTYSVTISPAGRTTIKLDGWTYTPDGKGGISSYPAEDQYFDYSAGYVPNTIYYYVSTTKEDHRSITNEAAWDKYLVMQFTVDGDVKVWFTTDPTISTPLGAADYTITPENMIFDNAGVYLKNVNVNSTNAKNLSLYLNKDGYASTDRAFSFVSSDEGSTYRGYSYTMKLTTIPIP
ncbi:MAG: hypothetical protein IJT86_03290 [Spirochaetales bacterium]|nr:hypothetical protein [Spirochaetales bacterium]MBQ4500368.1 hypothetical protein [Spirochaetales bacterium]MBQ7729355.1 hypothetical protein [Spirochaetales bacterium]